MPSKAASAAARSAKATETPVPTCEVILDTAERLFAERGVDGVAVRDLARVMNLTAPSLYNHFPSKQALYEAVLERGLGPIVQAVAVAWRGGLQPGDVGQTLDVLVAHLTRHPHLAPLLQRALLDDAPAVQALLARWVGSLYREGMAVLRTAGQQAGWRPEDVPHLGLALFGMIFAYFTNASGVQRLAPLGEDPRSARALAVQRRVLEEAILRLLAPRPRKRRTSSHG